MLAALEKFARQYQAACRDFDAAKLEANGTESLHERGETTDEVWRDSRQRLYMAEHVRGAFERALLFAAQNLP